MSVYSLPKTLTNDLDKQRRTCFWQGLTSNKKKERWVKIYKSKKKGGNKTVGSVKPRRNDSPIWSGLLKIKHIYPKGEENEINSGGYVLV